ncbi:MAG: hypothetical protein IID45_13860 [Planctomycetes bacterium]|nr:hypothetical protein [Planctomycetota bacterium]
MSDIDKKIRQALVAEDSALFEEFREEQSMLEMVADTFRGRHRWLVVMVFVATSVFVALSVFCGIQFYRADGIRELILWAGGFGFSLLAVMANKIWFWMELNKNAVTREIKRVELQIAQLAARLEKV